MEIDLVHVVNLGFKYLKLITSRLLSLLVFRNGKHLLGNQEHLSVNAGFTIPMADNKLILQ